MPSPPSPPPPPPPPPPPIPVRGKIPVRIVPNAATSAAAPQSFAKNQPSGNYRVRWRGKITEEMPISLILKKTETGELGMLTQIEVNQDWKTVREYLADFESAEMKRRVDQEKNQKIQFESERAKQEEVERRENRTHDLELARIGSGASSSIFSRVNSIGEISSTLSRVTSSSGISAQVICGVVIALVIEHFLFAEGLKENFQRIYDNSAIERKVSSVSPNWFGNPRYGTMQVSQKYGLPPAKETFKVVFKSGGILPGFFGWEGQLSTE